MNRRELVATLAGALTLCWDGPGPPRVDHRRLRPGGVLSVRCPEADAFRVELAGQVRELRAPTGRARLRAPWLEGEGFVELRCVPLRKGRPVGPAACVAVLAGEPVFGA